MANSGKQLCMFLEEVEKKRLEEQLQGGYDWQFDKEHKIGTAITRSAEFKRFNLPSNYVVVKNGRILIKIPRHYYSKDFILNDVEIKSMERTMQTALIDEEVQIKFEAAKFEKDFDGVILHFEKY